MPKIFDNIEHHLVDALNTTLAISYRSDFCVGYFNLRGWKTVADQLDQWTGEESNRCRLLVGMQKLPRELLRDFFALRPDNVIDNQTAARIRRQLAQEFKDQLTIGPPTEADEIGLRKLARQLKAQQVVVKLFLRHALHAKLYLLFRRDPINPVIGYLGSSNLTLAGLAKQGELNIDVLDQDAAHKLAAWFEERWQDRWCLDISKELIAALETSWAAEKPVPPYHIYLKMAYHLSQEARAGLNEFSIPKVFEKQLLEFQEKAVLIAAHHLNKRGGVLVGDVVGLGKTIIATALARIFNDDFFLETLIICPKNLTPMWDDYAHQYGLRACKVLSLSRAQKALPDLRRYRLIIIDESHNLRNRDSKRYRALQEYIRLNDSKVILLSATPYNKTYLDLSNQLRLFLAEDQDLGISPERFIASVGGKEQFAAQFQTPLRSLAAFEKSAFIDDWRELMRLYLVRRTRSFIKENYAEIDPAQGRKYLLFADGRRAYFPDRIPKKVEYPFHADDPADQYARLYSEEVVTTIDSLNLPRYGLRNYLHETPPVAPTEKETVIMANLSRAGKRLMGFCRTNLFKRLESSGHAFLLSVSRHILRNYLFIHAIEHDRPLPIGAQELNLLDDFLDDGDLEQAGADANAAFILDEARYRQQAAQLYEQLAQPSQTRLAWIRAALFQPALTAHLYADSRALLQVLQRGQDWTPAADRQLNALHRLCTVTHPREKLLIFTQYADTAQYLSAALHKRGVKQLACVTGGSKNPTALAYRFSPVSNNKPQLVGTPEELRVVISTDVLSEGQNLQDAHIVVNYDLPWALIRLIQRAGRVDRIGQQAEQILCYSFLPEEGVERIIKLRGRLTHRIRENAEVVGSDEIFFEGDPVNMQDLYNEKSGLLDEEDEGEVDLASYAFQIWKNATDANPELKQIIPNLANVVYSTKALAAPLAPRNVFTSVNAAPGVIVYTRTAEENDVLAWIDEQGRLITQSQFTILKAAHCASDTPPQAKLPNHHALVEQALAQIQEIESTLGGQLGKKTSPRYRTYMRLSRHYELYRDALFGNEPLKRAIDDIYNYPLQEYAREVLNRQLKTGIRDDDLAELVISLREEEKLCLVNDDEQVRKDPQIICSLGLR